MDAHESKRHVIAVETPSGTHKIFALSYSKKDGSLYLHLPYLLREGLIGVTSGTQTANGTLSVRNFTRVGNTKNQVKFTYHPDGRTHFSQDGRIYRTLPHVGVPLAEKTGRICSVTAYGLGKFSRVRQKDLRENPTKKGILALFSGTELVGVSFTVLLKSEDEVRSQHSQGPVGTVTTADRSVSLPAIAIAQDSAHRPHTRVVLVAFQALDSASPPSESCLIFQGPFVRIPEAPSRGGDLFAQTVIYPASLGEDLSKAVPSVDLN